MKLNNILFMKVFLGTLTEQKMNLFHKHEQKKNKIKFFQ